MPAESTGTPLSIEKMSARELGEERHRLINELLGSDNPTDPFERVALLEERKADSDNPAALKLGQVEEALRQRTAPDAIDQEGAKAPAHVPFWSSLFRALGKWDNKRKKPEAK
ncbi:MAG: hypothetical protein QM758_13280 [Armatimonas sp.]